MSFQSADEVHLNIAKGEKVTRVNLTHRFQVDEMNRMSSLVSLDDHRQILILSRHLIQHIICQKPYNTTLLRNDNIVIITIEQTKTNDNDYCELCA